MMQRFASYCIACLIAVALPVTVCASEPAIWLYYATNLQVPENVNELEQVWRRAAAAGYSRILLTDSKFARLGDLGESTKTYFSNINRVKHIANELKLDIVPALFSIGYSNDL